MYARMMSLYLMISFGHRKLTFDVCVAFTRYDYRLGVYAPVQRAEPMVVQYIAPTVGIPLLMNQPQHYRLMSITCQTIIY